MPLYSTVPPRSRALFLVLVALCLIALALLLRTPLRLSRARPTFPSPHSDLRPTAGTDYHDLDSPSVQSIRPSPPHPPWRVGNLLEGVSDYALERIPFVSWESSDATSTNAVVSGLLRRPSPPTTTSKGTPPSTCTFVNPLTNLGFPLPPHHTFHQPSSGLLEFSQDQPSSQLHPILQLLDQNQRAFFRRLETQSTTLEQGRSAYKRNNNGLAPFEGFDVW